MAHGVYHFMTWCSTAAEQARWFIQNVPNDPTALPPVLDLEWNNHSSCKNKWGKADILEKVRVMLAAMEKHTGKMPIIYTDIAFHRDILAGEHFDNAFWLRSTAAEPHERYTQPPLDVLAVDADRHGQGRPHRGRPQCLLSATRTTGRCSCSPAAIRAASTGSARRADAAW